ncbi:MULTISPECIES: flagellar protein FlaG [Neptunomonas]|uniref:Flagellar protein FlaG n=1 Tax=Neptunomonas marina TaxID=1815562 RepID=A0A437Q6U9_9GAMM|nr:MULTISPECIES: flagellar protein FlaG [Neptunomonas]RVU30252.1 flagellar protein FlaG [Neptunomonas marina]
MSVESMNATSMVSTTTQPANTQQVNQNQQAAIAEKQSQAAEAQEAQKLTAEEVQDVVDKLNDFMQGQQRNLNFSVDKDTDNLIVKVMDTQTEEVIRQFPSEETLKLAKHIEGMLGLIFNDKA